MAAAVYQNYLGMQEILQMGKRRNLQLDSVGVSPVVILSFAREMNDSNASRSL
jgi:hypothetical protein